MIRSILIIVMMTWFFAFIELRAQEGEDAPDATTDETRECIPAEEAEQSSGDESGPSEEGDDENAEPDLPICEDEAADDPIEEPAEAEPEPEEEEIGEDVNPEEDFEVNPEDEISEDFPVPLPSDI